MTAYDDFRFASTGDLADLDGPVSRFNHNITAIKLLKSLEAEGRAHGALASDEQRRLARYSGWGDGEVLNRLFPYGAFPRAPIHPELDGILTIEEREKIASSALNAHYTSLPIIGAIYESLNYMGIGALDSLRILEPAAGIGHFFGVMPPEIAAKAERVAVELDSITARILQHLYPNVKVFSQGFEESSLPNDYFDLALGNVPFGNIPVHDPWIKERCLKAAIHDYFFARSLKLVKPGGIVAFITSRYTLDKVDSRVRRHIAERADLLAAARLPESAFRKNAGTEVVTDVLILRKKFKSGGIDEKTDWLETDIFPNDLDYRVPINRLYIERPDLMLGVPGCSRGMYSDCEFTLKPDGRHLASVLRDSLISQLPYQAITAAPSQPAMMAPSLAPSLIEDAQEKEKANAANLDRLSGTSRQRSSLLLDIYSAAKRVIRLQLVDAGDEKLTRAQRELNDIYFRFTTRYGRINAKQNLKDLDRRSPIVPFLKALEEPAGKGEWKRAAIFHSRTIRPHKNFTHISSPKDALFFCLNECGRVDLDRIAALTGQTRGEAANALRGLESRLEKSLATQRELEHRRKQIAIELGKGWEPAGKYQELKLRLDAINQSLIESGAEIEAPHELSNLAEDALQPIEVAVGFHQILSLVEDPGATAQEETASSDGTPPPSSEAPAVCCEQEPSVAASIIRFAQNDEGVFLTDSGGMRNASQRLITPFRHLLMMTLRLQ